MLEPVFELRVQHIKWVSVYSMPEKRPLSF